MKIYRTVERLPAKVQAMMRRRPVTWYFAVQPGPLTWIGSGRTPTQAVIAARRQHV